MSTPLIRTATIEDAEPLQRYAELLFSETLPGVFRRPTPTVQDEIAFVESHLAQENSTLLLAVWDGEVVGVIGMMGRRLPQEAHVGEIGLSVHRDHRGRGIGSALVGALLAWAPEHGVTRIEVRAFATNPRALALYRRLGFEDEGTARQAVTVDGELVDVHMLAMLL